MQIRRSRGDICAGLSLLLCAVSCRHGGEPRAPATLRADRGIVAAPSASGEAAARTLETFAAPPYTYQLFIANQPEADPYGIRLVRTTGTYDEVVLEDPSCGSASVHPVESVRGADAEAKAWTTDAERCEMAIAARTVTLGSQHTGLLLTQAKGFEYRHSSHYLYIPDGDRLRLAWHYDESFGGEERTSVRVIAGAAPERQDLAFIRVLRASDGTLEVGAQRLRFDPATKEFAASSLPDRDAALYFVVVGGYGKASEALRLDTDCRSELDLFESAFFPALRLPALYFARIFAHRADAERLIVKLAGCSDLPAARVVEYRVQGGEVPHNTSSWLSQTATQASVAASGRHC